MKFADEPRKHTFNPIKWLLYLMITACMLIVLAAIVQPEQLRSFTYALKQKIVQTQPLAQYIGPSIQSFLP